ncbi:MAG TPA: LuxR C-terminal-related transcriptional regulator [Candidatus Dormibacteraeota bacterium]|jgi:DNA-binding CsgD family transcriptional regulator|nr:LuxR C-terminal-related transcriptional regulator [Candidatus Dormibacteraeota bacterium]
MVHADLHMEELRWEAMRCLQEAVPFDGWCWSSVDPLYLVPIRSVTWQSAVASTQQKLWEIEYVEEPELFTLAQLATGPQRVDSLREATGGDPARSRRWCELMRPCGIADELRAALVTGGHCWGSLALYRERSSGWFDQQDRESIARLVPLLAEHSRGTFSSVSPLTMDRGRAGGVVVLDAGLRPLTRDGQGARWLSHLPGRLVPPSQPLPALIYALVARLRAGLAARARTWTTDGRWALVEVSRLEGAASAGVFAITIQRLPPQEAADLRMCVAGLSRRERELASLVLRGSSTAEIGTALRISRHTVRDHLKAIFEKLGVRSRGQLTARLLGIDDAA